MHQSVLVYTNVNEGSDVCYICHDARQFHSFVQVFHRLHASVKFEFLNLLARVASGLLQLLHDVGEGG